MATKKTASGSAADGPKAMPREKLARRVYEYGGGGNVNMNAVSQAIERGETAPPVALRNTLAQIDEYLSWPNGSRMGGPLGGKIDHAELREIRGVPRALLVHFTQHRTPQQDREQEGRGDRLIGDDTLIGVHQADFQHLLGVSIGREHECRGRARKQMLEQSVASQQPVSLGSEAGEEQFQGLVE